MLASKDSRISKNAAGFLVQASRHSYELQPPSPRPAARKLTKHVPVANPPSKEELQAEAELQRFLNSMNSTKRIEFETEALASASRFHKAGLERAKVNENQKAFESYQRMIFWAHFLSDQAA